MVDAGTRNPWVALDVATDPVAHALRLRRAHENSLAGGIATAELRGLVAESWRRIWAPTSAGRSVSRETPIIDANAIGTVTTAGWVRAPRAPRRGSGTRPAR
jgi:hypothetical protein